MKRRDLVTVVEVSGINNLDVFDILERGAQIWNCEWFQTVKTDIITFQEQTPGKT